MPPACRSGRAGSLSRWRPPVARRVRRKFGSPPSPRVRRRVRAAAGAFPGGRRSPTRRPRTLAESGSSRRRPPCPSGSGARRHSARTPGLEPWQAAGPRKVPLHLPSPRRLPTLRRGGRAAGTRYRPCPDPSAPCNEGVGWPRHCGRAARHSCPPTSPTASALRRLTPEPPAVQRSPRPPPPPPRPREALPSLAPSLPARASVGFLPSASRHRDRVCDSSRRAPCATEILHRWARTPEPEQSAGGAPTSRRGAETRQVRWAPSPRQEGWSKAQPHWGGSADAAWPSGSGTGTRCPPPWPSPMRHQ
mmetsp:Transcript_107384/g.256542  ORF Transcript_107384/g.256542 Transcript_107384/m.256542 type:complete len:305 (+) Transcript_107384:3020-3934(+)